MARTQSVLLLTLGCLLLHCWSAMGTSCTARPPPVVITVNGSWPSPFGGYSDAQPLIVDELQGKTGLNTANLIIPPGKGFPPHRHPGKEEIMYITKGSCEITVWLPGHKTRTTFTARAGDMHYLPAGGIHQVTNKQKAGNMEFIMFLTPGPITLEAFRQWPARLDVPVRAIVNAVDTLVGCPPGHEPKHSAGCSEPAAKASPKYGYDATTPQYGSDKKASPQYDTHKASPKYDTHKASPQYDTHKASPQYDSQKASPQYNYQG